MIPLFKVRMSPLAPAAVTRVLQSGMIGEGPVVKLFQENLTNLFQTPHVTVVNSCTSAIIMALRLAGIKPGDEIISSPFTMVATNMAILAVGAKIKWADPSVYNLSLTRRSINKVITPNTKAIVVTAVGGIIPDQLQIYDIPVILDAAHAIGSSYVDEAINSVPGGRYEHISRLYDYACFSFQSIKQLTTGDGGALVVRNNENHIQAEKMKWFGMSRIIPKGMSRLKYQMTADISEFGGKYHMNDIAAAIGNENLKLLPQDLACVRIQAEAYTSAFEEKVGHYVIHPNHKPSWWLYWVRVKYRNRFIARMEKLGIATSPMWRPNNEYSVFTTPTKEAKGVEGLTGLKQIQREIVFIPIGWWLSDDNINYIIESVLK